MCNTVVRSAKQIYYMRFFEINRKTIRAVLNHINKLKSELSVSPPTSDPIKLNTFFVDLGSNIIKNLPANCDNFLSNVSYCSHCFKLEDTNADEIKRFCCTLKPKKSAGADKISTSLLQIMIDLVAEPLTYIFNLSFHTGAFPTDFKLAKVIPIFKGSDSNV